MSEVKASEMETTSEIALERKDERPIFDESKVASPSYEYVCWIDVMGSESTMLRSLSIASNFVMKLHVASLKAQISYPDVELFPVIDGLYACSPNQSWILGFVNKVFSSLTVEFLLQADALHRFMIRAGLAYGRIRKGKDAVQGSYALGKHTTYCERILIGMPLIQAYQSEKSAPPFGLYIDESARAFAPQGTNVLAGTLWPWWRYYNQPTGPQLVPSLKEALQNHLG